jgi:hypothetical protein
MFKYQHVCCGSLHNFIVTCPEGSMQEGGVNADSANVSKNRHDMIVLGFDLMEITSQKVKRPLFQGIESSAEREVPARAQKLAMKVGLSSGPAAGIVLGRCRRFYCIYGPSLLPISRPQTAASSLLCIMATQSLSLMNHKD